MTHAAISDALGVDTGLSRATSDGVLLLDAEGHVVSANEIALAMLEVTFDDLVGSPFLSIVHRADLLATVLRLERVLARRPSRATWICRLRDGRQAYGWMRVTALPSPATGPGRTAVLVLRNIPGL